MLLNTKCIFSIISIFGFFITLSADEAIPQYSATITRDIYGVPHVHGVRDSDAAFGLAYAQADDDIKNILSTIELARAGSG